MRGRIRRLGPATWLICATALWIAALTTARASTTAPGQPARLVQNSPTTQNPPQKAAAPATTDGANYVGEDTCLTCHEAQGKGAFADTAHHRASDPRTPAAKQGCETCHGPGSKHIQDPAANPMRNFKTLKPEEASAVCLTCHNTSEHALWEGSTHESRGLTCTTCHSVHSPESDVHQLKAKTEEALCATCHRTEVNKLQKSQHMPVGGSQMTCTTCHNVHGSTNVKLLRTGDSVSDACTSCHADKRGPYLWEHAPVAEGNCTACHDPHGSSNDRMLVAKLPMLCQRCHISTRHPPTIYDATQLASGSNRLLGRSCVQCHANIHGSNHPAGQYFLR